MSTEYNKNKYMIISNKSRKILITKHLANPLAFVNRNYKVL